MRLKGKIAVVTGGTSGIGRGIVERFIEEGATVYFTGRRAAMGAEVSKATGAHFVEADASLEVDARRTIETAAQSNGRIDILVNNAGNGAGGGLIQDLDMESFDEMIAIHLRAAVIHIKHVSTKMRHQRSGSIINISSVAGHRTGFSESLGYSVAKAGVIHLTRCVAMELGEDFVRCNSISPGGVATGMFSKSMGKDHVAAEATAETFKLAIAQLQTVPRAGLPLDIANAALFLAGDESSFLTGTDVVVDGGLVWGRRYSEAATGWQAMRDLLGE